MERFCSHFQYEPMAFDTADRHGKPIYHTNVMMAMGQDFVVVCLDSIQDQQEQEKLLDSFSETQKEVILRINALRSDFDTMYSLASV